MKTLLNLPGCKTLTRDAQKEIKGMGSDCSGLEGSFCGVGSACCIQGLTCINNRCGVEGPV